MNRAGSVFCLDYYLVVRRPLSLLLFCLPFAFCPSFHTWKRRFSSDRGRLFFPSSAPQPAMISGPGLRPSPGGWPPGLQEGAPPPSLELLPFSSDVSLSVLESTFFSPIGPSGAHHARFINHSSLIRLQTGGIPAAGVSKNPPPLPHPAWLTVHYRGQNK